MPELDHTRNLPRTIWTAAAIGAVAIHAGGIALALTSMQPESATDLGAPAIEIGIELTAPRVDPSELPVGPDTEPAETDDPDRVVAPNETKKPEEAPKL